MAQPIRTSPVPVLAPRQRLLASQEYLLAQLVEEAHIPTLEEVLDRAGGRAGGRATFKAAATAVRADRDAG